MPNFNFQPDRQIAGVAGTSVLSAVSIIAFYNELKRTGQLALGGAALFAIYSALHLPQATRVRNVIAKVPVLSYLFKAETPGKPNTPDEKVTPTQTKKM